MLHKYVRRVARDKPYHKISGTMPFGNNPDRATFGENQFSSQHTSLAPVNPEHGGGRLMI